MKETLSHRIIRSKRNETGLAKEIPYVSRPDVLRENVYCTVPSFLIGAALPKAIATSREAYSYDSEWLWRSKVHLDWVSNTVWKIRNFPATQILREINISDLFKSKNGHFDSFRS